MTSVDQPRSASVDKNNPVKGPRFIDVDVHEHLRSVEDLIPYLDDPWRSRFGPDAWEGPPNMAYSWPLIGGVARADAATTDGSPAGSSYELLRGQLLDAYDVEYAVLISLFSPTDMVVQPEFATALASAYNDWMIENWLERDERFRGTITVAAQDPIAAAIEIERVASHERMVQVLLPALSRDVLGRPFYNPIFEAADRNGLVIAFHQTDATQTAVGLPPYFIEWHTAIPQAWQCQLLGLIFHGIFDKYPNIRVLLAESGWTWLPWLMWRADQNFRSLRREVPWVQRKPSEYIRERVRVATQPMDYPENPQDLYRMFELIGTEDILVFSTDYPHWDFDAPDRALPRAFPEPVRQKIYLENARELYGNARS